MPNQFTQYSESLSSPIDGAALITPSDSTDLPSVARTIYVGGAGNLRVTLPSGADVTFINVGEGFQPIIASRVWATGTTATNLIAGY